MKPTRHYPKRHYKPNLRILAAYMQPLKVNAEPTKTIAGETIVCEPIAKRTNALGKVSRGLDRTNPEYNRKSRAKLGQLLQQAIGQVYQLERDYEQLLIDRACLIDLVVELAAWHESTKAAHLKIPSDKLQDIVWGMMEYLDMLEDAPEPTQPLNLFEEVQP